MATPGLTDEFNGVSKLLQGLFMWLLGTDAEGNSIGSKAGGGGFMEMLRKLLHPDTGNAALTGTFSDYIEVVGATKNDTTPARTSQTAQTDPSPSGLKTAHNVVTIGDSLAQGYGQALTKEFGAANVTNYGVVGAGLKGGTHLAQVDWSKIGKDTVAVISVGTNDVGFLSSRNQTKIDEYAQQAVDIAGKVKERGGTPVMVAMRAPDKPLEIRDNVTHQMRPQTEAEFTAWKNTMNAMNDAMAKAAAEKGIAYVTPEGGSYVAGGLHQTLAGYQTTADNALKQAGVTVTSG
jgi:lysophospholipase L1-like esterase